jgi:hypothetical protein
MRHPQIAFAVLFAGCSSGAPTTAAPMPTTALATAAPASVMPTITAAPATAVPATATGAPAACGERGQPNCPLQAFMKTKMGPALQRGDLPALAGILDLVAANVPDPSFDAADPRWSKIAQDGAAAARANDTAGARAACKACHTAHQKRFKADFRTWQVPPGMQ